MSPEAIDRRFRTLSELYQFATTVKNVKWLGKTKDLDLKELKATSGGSMSSLDPRPVR